MGGMMVSSSRITIQPGVCGGHPTIRGMRITVANILELLAGGMTPEEVLADYPYLEAEDIHACLAYASQLASHRQIVFDSPVPSP
jgi:uncharacterized protein (DUF433 family)